MSPHTSLSPSAFPLDSPGSATLKIGSWPTADPHTKDPPYPRNFTWPTDRGVVLLCAPSPEILPSARLSIPRPAASSQLSSLQAPAAPCTPPQMPLLVDLHWDIQTRAFLILAGWADFPSCGFCDGFFHSLPFLSLNLFFSPYCCQVLTIFMVALYRAHASCSGQDTHVMGAKTCQPQQQTTKQTQTQKAVGKTLSECCHR